MFRGIKLRRVVEREVSSLEDEQLTTLLEAVSAKPKCNYLPHAITFAIESCTRQGEMLKLEWPMVDFKHHVLNLPGRISKTGQPRSIPMSCKCKKALEAIRDLAAAGKAVYRLNVVLRLVQVKELLFSFGLNTNKQSPV